MSPWASQRRGCRPGATRPAPATLARSASTAVSAFAARSFFPGQKSEGWDRRGPVCSSFSSRLITRATRCAGYFGISRSQCEEKGCCWSPALKHQGIPWCFESNAASGPAYQVTRSQATTPGLKADLSLPVGPPVLPKLGPDAPRLQLELSYLTPERLRLRVTPLGCTFGRGIAES